MMKELDGLEMMPMKQMSQSLPIFVPLMVFILLIQLFQMLLKSGITTAHVMPGSANVIGGTTSVIKTCWKKYR